MYDKKMLILGGGNIMIEVVTAVVLVNFHRDDILHHLSKIINIKAMNSRGQVDYIGIVEDELSLKDIL